MICVLLFLFFKYCTNDASAFNLECRSPIVKYGDADTYFGYSVAGHEIVLDRNYRTEKWILVGAPLGQNLQPGTNHSGALFKCPINLKTNDCSQILTDGRPIDYTGDANVLNFPLNEEEFKDDQWMGATVRSQGKGGVVLVCAHRYILKKETATKKRGEEDENLFGQGLCYVLSNDLSQNVYNSFIGQNRTDWILLRNGNYQIGTSGAFLEDGTILLGAPGFNYNGNIFIFPRDGESYKRLNNPHVMPPNSYTGMSVTGGRYGGKSMCYVAGIPRTKRGGQVSIFALNARNELRIPYEFFGEQIGSSFGYEIITADINGDRNDDLLVAAPFYFNEKVGGAVYVFQSDPGKVCFEVRGSSVTNKEYALKLFGKPNSQFGVAMANIGDIDKNGCDDIAIGAPYESDGVVYIYLGTKDGLSNKPSQIISPSELRMINRPIKSFGSSLSGKVDFDGNSYPDLVIGSYQSSTVVALLSRPIINFKSDVIGSLRNIDVNRKKCSTDTSKKLTCFEFQTCCTVFSHQEQNTQSISLQYKIDAETFEKSNKFSRVYFANNNGSHVIVRNIRVNGSKKCYNHIVFVRDDIRDVYSAIKFRLSYSIVENELGLSSLNSLNPILNRSQSERVFRATFKKDCASEDICESLLRVNTTLNLEKKDDVYDLILGETRRLLLNITLKNDLEPAYEPKLFVAHHRSITYITASKGRAICNPFNETLVECSFGNILLRNAIEQLTLHFDSSDYDGLSATSFKIHANATSHQDEWPYEEILVNVIRQTELRVSGTNYPEQVYYSDRSSHKNVINNIEDLGMSVTHIYEIQNLGPARIPSLDIQIEWPSQVHRNETKSEWLLYITDDILIEGTMGECSNDDVDPLELITQSRRQKIRRNVRSADSELQNEYLIWNQGDQTNEFKSCKDRNKTDVINLDCGKNTTKCVKLKCKLYNLPSGSDTHISVKARLWNASLAADYQCVDHVTISSSIRIFLPEIHNIRQLNGNNRTTVITTAYPDLHIQSGEKSVPIWVIIASVVGGLLVQAIISYIFWKCGFFKRLKPQETPEKSSKTEWSWTASEENDVNFL